MTDTWASASEVVCGKIIKGKLAVSAVRPELFIEPYDRIIELIQKGEGKVDREEIISRVGMSPVMAALDAANTAIDGVADWIALLENVSKKCILAEKLRRHAKRLDQGEDVETVEIVEDFRQFEGKRPYMTPLDEIERGTHPFIPSGWEAIDKEFGGWPKAGLITVGSSPKVGKTSFMTKSATEFVKFYPAKKAGIFTLEMPGTEYRSRVDQLTQNNRLTQDQMHRIVIDDSAGMTVAEVANKAAREPDLGFVGVDFADLMIQDESNESEMSKIYRTLANLGKSLGIPVMLLGQFNRSYTGGVPLPRHIRYTSMAEALSWMLLVLYSPQKDFGNKNDAITLPQVPEVAYIVAWLIRGGFIIHPDDNPGAIPVTFRGATGWGDTSLGWNLLHTE